MNKLLVSDIIDLNDNNCILNLVNNDITINVYGDNTIYLIKEEINNLTINMQNKSILRVYIKDNDIKNINNITINQEDNSKVYFNVSCSNNDNYNLRVDNNIKGNNNESYINIRNISNNGLSKIIINVLVDKKTINNIAVEDLKGINNGGFVHIEPNIVALSNEVEANHLTTIGGLDKDSLNYLMSKGIKEDISKKILLEGFLKSNMDNYINENYGGD